MENKNTWELFDEGQLEEVEVLSKEYRDFLDNGKTERECVDAIVNMIEKEGYKELVVTGIDGLDISLGAVGRNDNDVDTGMVLNVLAQNTAVSIVSTCSAAGAHGHFGCTAAACGQRQRQNQRQNNCNQLFHFLILLRSIYRETINNVPIILQSFCKSKRKFLIFAV